MAERDQEKDYVDAHIRFPPALHGLLVNLADENYVSLNKLVVIVMSKWASEKGVIDM